MGDDLDPADWRAAEAALARLLPLATAGNPKYRSAGGEELTAWLTKSVRFAPSGRPGGIAIVMSEEAIVFRNGVQTAVNTHEAAFAIEDVEISEYAYPADVTETGEKAIGVLIKCDSGKCIRSKWNGEEAAADQSDLYVYDAALRAKILKAFHILKKAAAEHA